MRTIVITAMVHGMTVIHDMKRMPVAFVGIAALAIGLSACGSAGDSTAEANDASGASSGPSMVATTTVWGSVAGQVAECAGGSVTTLMPVGADPHDFTPSSDQVATIVGADLVIANGLGLEEGLESALESAQQDGATVFQLGPALDPIPFAAMDDEAPTGEDDHAGEEDDHAGEDDHADGEDPHVWLDVARAADAAQLIGDEMADVTGDAAYAECGATVAAELRATNDEVVQTLGAIPADKRILVTDHDSFGYFADAYDFRIEGVVIPGGSTLAEPSSAELAALAQAIKDSGVSTIFANTANPSALVDALAAEVGDVQVVELYVGSVGEPGSGADTYQGMMNTNATRIADALAG